MRLRRAATGARWAHGTAQKLPHLLAGPSRFPRDRRARSRRALGQRPAAHLVDRHRLRRRRPLDCPVAPLADGPTPKPAPRLITARALARPSSSITNIWVRRHQCAARIWPQRPQDQGARETSRSDVRKTGVGLLTAIKPDNLAVVWLAVKANRALDSESRFLKGPQRARVAFLGVAHHGADIVGENHTLNK